MDQQIVQVGPKGRHLEIPKGFSVVTGPMNDGDLVANIRTVKWERIDEEDVGIDSSIYDFVIRKD
jgi:hypothetical protein